jgi:anaerobic magnesium-protoporphyrin IX monomethyl ester cyclase
MLDSTTTSNGIRKVLLVFPPTRVGSEQILACMPPLGAMYLAATFRRRYDVKILDATAEGFSNRRILDDGFRQVGLHPDEIKERIREYAPDVVGVTTLFSSSYPCVEEVLRAAKEVNPGVITVVGGTHPAFLARQCLEQSADLDYIVIGEGEMSGLELLDCLNEGRSVAAIDGLAWREGGEVRINPKTTFIEDLDSLPWPARDLVDLGIYAKGNRAHGVYSKEAVTTTIQSSRGCPAKCTFCSSMRFWGQKYRGRSAESVLGEIEQVRNTYGIREFQFEDDNLTMDRKRAKTLFNAMIDRKLDIVWSTPNGVAMWTLDEEMLSLMKRAGCYEVTLAFESGNQEVLRDVIKKPTNLKHAEKVVEAVKKVGLDHNAFFIMGFPGETTEQMKESYELAKRLKLQSAWFFVANPLPGTELYEQCQEKGLLREGFDFTNTAYTRSAFNTPEWASGEVEKLVQSSLLKIQLWSHIRQPIHHLKRYLSRPEWTFELGLLLSKRAWRWLTKRRSAEPVLTHPAFTPTGPSVEAGASPIVVERRNAAKEAAKRPADVVVDVHVPVRFQDPAERLAAATPAAT